MRLAEARSGSRDSSGLRCRCACCRDHAAFCARRGTRGRRGRRLPLPASISLQRHAAARVEPRGECRSGRAAPSMRRRSRTGSGTRPRARPDALRRSPAALARLLREPSRRTLSVAARPREGPARPPARPPAMLDRLTQSPRSARRRRRSRPRPRRAAGPGVSRSHSIPSTSAKSTLVWRTATT